MSVGVSSFPCVVTLSAAVAVSLSEMVTVASSFAASIVTPLFAEVSVSITVSLASSKASLRTLRSIVAVVWPAVTITLPERAVKSVPEVAVPETV